MKFSYGNVWDDMRALIRAETPLVAAVAGVFLFFPALLVAYLVPAPPPPPAAPAEALAALGDYWAANWYWYLLDGVVSMVGSLAVLILLLKPRGTTVGAAIAGAALLTPTYLIASLVAGIAMGMGFILLIVPGLYLFGRLAPLPAVVAAEGRRNPLDAIHRTFVLTAGHGWAILGLILLILVPSAFVLGAIRLLFETLFVALAGQNVGNLLATIVVAAASAALTTFLLGLYAALYRRLSKGI